MKESFLGYPLAAVFGLGLGILSAGCALFDQTTVDLEIGDRAIGGRVTGERGPEAGVWVIAETNDLPTLYRKIVVTDEEGRFVIPELPSAAYDVWVRGYGLQDSRPVRASPPNLVELRVGDAADPRHAAQIYPATYWLSLYEPPHAERLPERFVSQDHWLASMKSRCMLCHQLGGQSTRRHDTPEAWDSALKLAGTMDRDADNHGRELIMETFSDWGKRIAAGEIPPAPPRPEGIERNVVITQWRWGRWDGFIHDVISTDKRNPHLYPQGKVYGIDLGQDILWAVDPVRHTVDQWKVPTRGGFDIPWADQPGIATWRVYNNPANPHNPMLDDAGKVWITTQIRRQLPEDTPAWARHDPAIVGQPGNPRRHHRQLGYFDTKSEQMVLIDTAFGTHHLQFDWEGRLWLSGDSYVLGMFDPALFDPEDPEGTEAKAQKWWEMIDSKTGKAVPGFLYGIIANPVDGTVWAATTQAEGPANRIIKFDPKTEKFTNYPLPPPGRVPRGIDAGSDGILWFSTASGHLGRFDPGTGGFRYWESPAPKFRGTGSETGTADMHYYIWVDQFNTFGMGKDTVVLTGTNDDSLLLFDPQTERFTVVRFPYPLGLFHRGLDGRIDDPDAGWKGRGLWVNYGSDPVRFTETERDYLNHVQLRPSPLAY